MWICTEIKHFNPKKIIPIDNEQKLKDFLRNKNLDKYYEEIRKLKIGEIKNTTDSNADYYSFKKFC